MRACADADERDVPCRVHGEETPDARLGCGNVQSAASTRRCVGEFRCLIGGQVSDMTAILRAVPDRTPIVRLRAAADCPQLVVTVFPTQYDRV